MPLAPWLLPADYLSAMREGAGLGLNIRAQNQREQEAAAADALKRQSLFQDAIAQQQQRAAQQAQLQQQAAQALAQQQLHYDQLGQENAFHQDTLAEQQQKDAREEAANALRERRQNFLEQNAAITQNRLADLGERKASLEEEKLKLGTQKERQARAYIDSVKASLPEGRTLTPEEESDLTSKYLAGMTALNASPSMLKDINSEAANVRMVQNASQRIADFNAKYGDKAFDKFVGPLNGRMTNLRKNFIPSDKLDAATKEAADIFRQVESIAQGYRKENFGTALTSTETERFRKILSDPNFADYTDSLESFGNSINKKLVSQLADYELAPNIPRGIKKEFLYSKKDEERKQPENKPAKTGSGLSAEARRARIAELKAKLNQ